MLYEMSGKREPPYYFLTNVHLKVVFEQLLLTCYQHEFNTVNKHNQADMSLFIDVLMDVGSFIKIVIIHFVS